MIIGVIGKKQSGKDTVCKIIQAIDVYSLLEEEQTINEFVKEYLDGRRTSLMLYRDIVSSWHKHAFADKIKKCAATILGVPAGCFENEDFKKAFTSLPLSNKDGNHMTNREFLQYFGTEVGRSIDKDIWVKALIKDYLDTAVSIPNYGVTEDGQRLPMYRDTMYDNWIVPDVRFPNEVEEISKHGTLIRITRNTGLQDLHESETALDNYEFKVPVINIDNNGTMDDLINQVVLAINTIMHRQ